MEATAIQLNNNKESIILILIYSTPGKITERNVEFLIKIGHKVILVGGFNAKHVTWRARQNNGAWESRLNH
jgi:hypothetical protein